MSDKGSSKRTRVSNSSDLNDDTIIFQNPKPLKMIIPYDISIEKSKSATKKKKTSEKFSTSKIVPHVHVEPINVDKEYVPNPTKKNPYVEPIVESYVIPNVDESRPTYGCSQTEPTSVHVGEPPKSTNKQHGKSKPNANPIMVDNYLVDTHAFDKFFDDIINDNYVFFENFNDDILKNNHQNVEVEVLSNTSDGNNKFHEEVINEDYPCENDKEQDEINVEAYENGKSVTKPPYKDTQVKVKEVV
ncbi:hypothetical protein RYX36_034577 [Vicia faba]